jgi:hypothetical protein
MWTVGRPRRLRVGEDRFGTLLFFLLVAFVVSGASSSDWPKVAGATANLAALLAGFAATGLWADRARMLTLLLVGLVGGALVGAFEQTSVWSAVGALAQAVVLGAVLLATVRRVLSHDRVGLPTIAGAIAAYFLIGLVFAWLYLAAYGLLEAPILEPEEVGLPAYYSFVVLSTLGLGDVTPVDELVKRVTAVEAITGQIFLATLVARLVAMYGSSARDVEASDVGDRETS